MGAVFGNGNKPGVMGTGQQDIDLYDPNKGAFTLDQSGAKANNDARLGAVDARQTPQSQAAQADLSQLYQAQLQNAQVAQSQGVQLSPAERAQAAQVGSANLSQQVQLGQAAQANAAQLNSQDAQFRNNQVALSNQLTNQMNGQGPSLAASQYQQAQEKNLAGQMGAASAMGGRNAALGARQLASNAAVQGQQTARDVSNIRMQEQMNATQQLAGVSQAGRDQDINLAAQNAQLQQQAALANQGATNQFALQQGSMNMQNNQFNASSLNDRQLQQAQMQQQMNLANQAAGNQFALQQGQMNMQNNQFNAGAQNQAYLQNAQLNAQNAANYQQQYNAMYGQNIQNQQQSGLANQQAEFQNRQQQDAMAQFYNQQNYNLDARAQDAQMQYEQLMAQQSGQEAALQQQAYEAARQGQSSLTGGLIGAGASMLGSMSDKNVKNLSSASDKEVKTSISRADSKMKEYLESLRNGGNGAAFVGEGYPKGGNYSNKGGSLAANNYMSHSPAGNKDLGQAAPQPVEAPKVATDTASQNTAVTDDSKSKKDLESENARLLSLLQGMKSNQAVSPGFAGGLQAGGQLGTNLGNALFKKSPTDQRKTEVGRGDPGKGNTGFIPGADWQYNANQLYGTSIPGGQPNYQDGSMAQQAPPPPQQQQAMAPQQSPWQTPMGGSGGMSYNGGIAPDMSSHSPAGSKDLGGFAKVLRPNPEQEPQQFGKKQEQSKQQKMLAGPQAPVSGTSSMQMQMKNLGNTLGPGSSGSQTPLTYDKLNSNGSMDVMGSMANHNAMATAYSQPGGANNYSDYPGFGKQNAAGPGPSRGGPSSSVSDETKKNLSGDDAKIKDYLDNLHAYDYTYKEPEKPGRGEGSYVSPMAQEFEKSELGRTAVKETPDGKMVDYGKIMGTMAAADAYMNERINKLEGKKSKPPITKQDKNKK